LNPIAIAQIRVTASAFLGHRRGVASVIGFRRCRTQERWISSIRLINTQTMELEEPLWSTPRYAILSHTWGRDEVTFQDLQSGKGRQKNGFAKIKETCRLARLQGIPYAWIDTCCIDKTSSAELTQAINSMFRWYAESTVCYAYLDDLAPSDRVRDSENQMTMRFASCRWFTRGWTLQELIAPKRMEFYDSGWVCRGTKTGLSDILEAATRIDCNLLYDNTPLFSLPVARRMSWAAKR
jgi:hypothetical protein